MVDVDSVTEGGSFGRREGGRGRVIVRCMCVRRKKKGIKRAGWGELSKDGYDIIR